MNILRCSLSCYTVLILYVNNMSHIEWTLSLVKPQRVNTFPSRTGHLLYDDTVNSVCDSPEQTGPPKKLFCLLHTLHFVPYLVYPPVQRNAITPRLSLTSASALSQV